jgi:hypothetical protein
MNGLLEKGEPFMLFGERKTAFNKFKNINDLDEQ